VEGNPEHCINLLQLVHEISVMMGPEEGQAPEGEGETPEGVTETSPQKQSEQASSQKRARSYSDGGQQQPDPLFGGEDEQELDFAGPEQRDQHDNMQIVDGLDQQSEGDFDEDDQALYEQVVQAKQQMADDEYGQEEGEQ